MKYTPERIEAAIRGRIAGREGQIIRQIAIETGVGDTARIAAVGNA